VVEKNSDIASAWIQNCRHAICFGSDSSQADSTFWAFQALDRLCTSEPDEALNVVLLILHSKPEERVLYNLAAGPLEDLITRNGLQIIGRVEQIASVDSDFLLLIGGVWPDRASLEIQQRLQPLIARANATH
jgi:hypothetical protein